VLEHQVILGFSIRAVHDTIRYRNTLSNTPN
jgi:hypothetical protein